MVYVHLAGNDERDGVDRLPIDFVCAGDLAVRNAQVAAGQEAHTALRVSRLMVGERVEIVVLIFEEADVPISVDQNLAQEISITTCHEPFAS